MLNLLSQCNLCIERKGVSIPDTYGNLGSGILGILKFQKRSIRSTKLDVFEVLFCFLSELTTGEL